MDDIHATPAYVAAEFGQCSTMVTLLQHRADITIADTVRIFLVIFVLLSHCYLCISSMLCYVDEYIAS